MFKDDDVRSRVAQIGLKLTWEYWHYGRVPATPLTSTNMVLGIEPRTSCKLDRYPTN